MGDRGEVAVVVEMDGEAVKIVSYALPRTEVMFREGEVRNAYLAQSMELPGMEDSERELLTGFLNESVVRKDEN